MSRDGRKKMTRAAHLYLNKLKIKNKKKTWKAKQCLNSSNKPPKAPKVSYKMLPRGIYLSSRTFSRLAECIR